MVRIVNRVNVPPPSEPAFSGITSLYGAPVKTGGLSLTSVMFTVISIELDRATTPPSEATISNT